MPPPHWDPLSGIFRLYTWPADARAFSRPTHFLREKPWGRGCLFSLKRISERFRQFYFLTKSSTLLVKTSRKTKFLYSFSEEQNANLLPFFVSAQSFRLKVKKRYLFLKKKSGIFIFRVNDILTSILSAFHPFLTLPNDDLKHERGSRIFLSLSRDLIKDAKRYLFCSWKWCSQKRQNGTFFAVRSDIVKSAKKVPF